MLVVERSPTVLTLQINVAMAGQSFRAGLKIQEPFETVLARAVEQHGVDVEIPSGIPGIMGKQPALSCKTRAVSKVDNIRIRNSLGGGAMEY